MLSRRTLTYARLRPFCAMGKTGPRRSTVAKGLLIAGSRAQQGKHELICQKISKWCKENPKLAESVWDLVEQGLIGNLLGQAAKSAPEKPLSTSQLKLSMLPLHVVKPAVLKHMYTLEWFKNASNMKKLLAHDKQIWRTLILAITAESPDTALAIGTTPTEAVAFLVQRADAVGDRISKLEVSDTGVVDWASISPWILQVKDKHRLVLQHRFTGFEAPLGESGRIRGGGGG